MKLLILFINTLILILTEIGDFVLFYLGIAWKITKFLIRFLFSQVLQILKIPGKSAEKILSYSKTAKRKIDNYFALSKFRLLLLTKNIKRKFRPKRKEKIIKKKEVKQSLVTFYPPPKQTKLKFKFFVFGLFFCIVFVVIPISVYVFLSSLPNPNELSQREIPQTTKIYDRNGNLLYQIYANENRTLVPLNSIPKNLINATIAIEDKDFYQNPGFDINAILRAAIADLSGKPIQGGSTITQQLIKSTLLTPEVSVSRKIKEIVLAFWAEKIYSKNEILEMYFNQVSYGGTAWGIEAASETYFGENVKELDLAQSAFLAGMPQAPTTYSPYGDNPTLWKQRQKEVLAKMLTLKYISKDQRRPGRD